MTTYELAQTMAKLGAVTAAGLQYGKFVTAAFDGQVLNRPSQPSGQVAVKEALLIQYAGVYALPPSVPVLTKANVNGGEQLAYRITHPSQVTATLVGPDGQAHQLDTGSKQPGTYTFAWSSFDTEGTWHWNVQATDDQNRASTASQAFVYDLTLSGLAVPKSASTASGLHVGFTLSRPASVVLSIDGRERDARRDAAGGPARRGRAVAHLGRNDRRARRRRPARTSPRSPRRARSAPRPFMPPSPCTGRFRRLPRSSATTGSSLSSS